MIAHVDNRITYNGNGNATEFAYQFKILDRTDIKVMLTDADGKEKLLTKDYYVDVEKALCVIQVTQSAQKYRRAKGQQYCRPGGN